MSRSQFTIDGKSWEYRDPRNYTSIPERGEPGNESAYEFTNPLYDFSKGAVRAAGQRLGIQNVDEKGEVDRILNALNNPGSGGGSGTNSYKSDSKFGDYLSGYDRVAKGAGSHKGTDRLSGLDVRAMYDAREDFGMSDKDAAQEILAYARSNENNTRMGGGTEDALDKLRAIVRNSPDDKPESNEPVPSMDAELSPSYQRDKENVQAYEDYLDGPYTGPFGRSASEDQDDDESKTASRTALENEMAKGTSSFAQDFLNKKISQRIGSFS